MMRWLRAVLWIAGIGLGLPAFADGARAWLDRDTMQVGETVTLNVEVEGGAAGEPDFSSLAADFNLLGTQSSRQFNMSNGQSTSKNVWAIGLEPKHAGTIDIPALAVGALRTTLLQLTVLPAAAGAQGKAGDAVYVEVTAEPLAPYVQQQLRYVVKLYYAVDLTEGTLEEPAADGIVVNKLGRDRQYAATVGERRYRVLERHYALVPERSGRLTLPPIAFRGSALDSSDPTGFFRRGRALSARSDAVDLEVRPKPAQWGAAPWLPAASLELADDGSLPNEVAIGEPVTRTVRLRAQGLGYEQLPELAFEAPAGSELYPDKAETQTRDDGSWLYGERTRKFAFVPTRAGTLVLPSIEVAWWDTVHDRRVTAVLPAHELKVTAAAATAAITPDATPAAAPAATPVTVAWPQANDGPSVRLWRATALIALALWLLTSLAWWRA
ncbi:MAG: protein BatD, partial [Xanthomonadales bacterium]|nr:protein BatD [Xanthomonadales bacterium]